MQLLEIFLAQTNFTNLEGSKPLDIMFAWHGSERLEKQFIFFFLGCLTAMEEERRNNTLFSGRGKKVAELSTKNPYFQYSVKKKKKKALMTRFIRHIKNVIVGDKLKMLKWHSPI